MPDPAARAATEAGSCSVSLRIRHPSCDPNQITNGLGLTPDHAWACGEPRRTESGLPLGGIRHDSYWTATLPGVSISQWRTPERQSSPDAAMLAAAATGDLPGAMAQLQMQLQIMAQIRRHRAFIERLITEGGEVTFVVEMASDSGLSFQLDPALMKQLGALGVRLEFEFV
jgi:hypothetical protein